MRIEVAPASLYGLDNLPYGVFSPEREQPRVGARLGEVVVDLARLLGDPVFARPTLNEFLAQGPRRWARARAELRRRLAEPLEDATVHALDTVGLYLPVAIGDYVDFYASRHHASNVGRLFRPGAEPLLPNWKHLPVGYHGRSGTVIPSGSDIIRPRGQRKRPTDTAPSYGPSRALDIEVELGFVVGVGSTMGEPVRCAAFAEHVFGVVLVNDWSARDIQAWEYVPLGPFLGKSFATSISAWVTPLAALRAARVPGPRQEPAPLPYLAEAQSWGLDIELAVHWNGQLVSSPPYREMYWSPAQMLAHLTANGASCRSGDLFASGTVSGAERNQRGSFLELTWNGAEPVEINGVPREFLRDGDEVCITATAPGTGGGRIGLGEVRGRIQPARSGL